MPDSKLSNHWNICRCKTATTAEKHTLSLLFITREKNAQQNFNEQTNWTNAFNWDINE